MTIRLYPYYAGREKYRGLQRRTCECCYERATHIVTVQFSWSRGDDEIYSLCELHAMEARIAWPMFVDRREQRQAFMRESVDAQHEETGRMWTGERRALPPRYHEVSPCTCHPDDKPPRPCPHRYALTECRAAAAQSRSHETP